MSFEYAVFETAAVRCEVFPCAVFRIGMAATPSGRPTVYGRCSDASSLRNPRKTRALESGAYVTPRKDQPARESLCALAPYCQKHTPPKSYFLQPFPLTCASDKFPASQIFQNDPACFRAQRLDESTAHFRWFLPRSGCSVSPRPLTVLPVNI